MKKILVLFFLGFILSGCATYKFQKPATSGAKGYLVCYDGKPILEYTVGKEKSLPDLTLAKERFKRRRSTVEYYYKQMDLIDPVAFKQGTKKGGSPLGPDFRPASALCQVNQPL